MRQPTGKGLPDIVTNVHDVILSFTAPTYSWECRTASFEKKAGAPTSNTSTNRDGIVSLMSRSMISWPPLPLRKGSRRVLAIQMPPAIRHPRVSWLPAPYKPRWQCCSKWYPCLGLTLRLSNSYLKCMYAAFFYHACLPCVGGPHTGPNTPSTIGKALVRAKVASTRDCC